MEHPCGAKQAAEKSDFRASISQNIPQGLKRLRKKSEFRAKCAKGVPQGLKPDVFSAVYGTAEAVPFQNREFFRSL